MGIDWLRVAPQFLAEDGDKSYWKYWTKDVAADIVELDLRLPTFPKHELIACKDAVLAIFDGRTVPGEWGVTKIGATIGRISDTIVEEGKITEPD